MGRRRQRERKREGNRRYRFAEEREEEKEKEGQKVEEEEVCSLPFPFPPLFFPFSSFSFLPSPPPLKSGKWEIVSVFFVWEPHMNLDIFWELFKDDIEVWKLTAWQIPYRVFPPFPFLSFPISTPFVAGISFSLFPKALFCRVVIGSEGGGRRVLKKRNFSLLSMAICVSGAHDSLVPPLHTTTTSIRKFREKCQKHPPTYEQVSRREIPTDHFVPRDLLFSDMFSGSLGWDGRGNQRQAKARQMRKKGVCSCLGEFREKKEKPKQNNEKVPESKMLIRTFHCRRENKEEKKQTKLLRSFIPLNAE